MRKIKIEVNLIDIWTNRFDGLSPDYAEVIGNRVLELPFVKSVDWIHGHIELECTVENFYQKIDILKKHLGPAKMPGEYIEEVFHDWGNTPYTYKYHRGSYDFKGDDK